MKKQTKIVIGALVVVVLGIVMLSVFFPDVMKGKSSGTFAKADKYQKSQMTEKDIKLRSALTADTAKLKSTLQGLIYFSAFTEDLCLRIDTCLNAFQEKGMKSDNPGFAGLMAMKDYAVFIRNNNKALTSTIGMLSSFYFADAKDQSQDVEKNLRDFSNYVKLFAEKDKVLETAVKGMDNFIVGNKILKDSKDELKKLKSIRDQLLIKGIQVAALNQDKGLCAVLLNASMDNLGLVYISAQAGNGMNAVLTNATASLNFGSLLNAGVSLNAGLFNANQNLQGSQGVIYDKATLQFTLCNSGQIQGIGQFLNSVQLVGAVGGGLQGFNVVQSNVSLQYFFNSTSAISAVQMSAITGDLSRMVINSQMVQSMTGLCGNGGMGAFVLQSAGDQIRDHE